MLRSVPVRLLRSLPGVLCLAAVRMARRLAALQGFCQTLLAQEPEISDDQFATMAKAQATVLGLSTVQAEPVIEALVAEMFPALASDGPLDSDDDAGESSVDLD